MRKISIIVLLLLAGCAQKDPAREAEERYEMVVRHGNNGEICDAARKVAYAYLEAKDEKEYEFWRSMADASTPSW